MNVYADTSVIGGCFDQEFKEWSLALFEEFKSASKHIMLSDLTLEELDAAREEVRNKIIEIPSAYKFNIGITDEAIRTPREILNTKKP